MWQLQFGKWKLNLQSYLDNNRDAWINVTCSLLGKDDPYYKDTCNNLRSHDVQLRRIDPRR